MSTLNTMVVTYAEQQLGRRVFAVLGESHGECWDLAFLALESANAKTPPSMGGRYVWSTKTVTISQAKPGDIIQYHKLVLTVKTTKDVVDDDGQEFTEIFEGTIEIGDPRHTAIIKSIGRNGNVTVLEQNIGGVLETHQRTYRIIPGNYEERGEKITVTKKRGKYTIYRPAKK